MSYQLQLNSKRYQSRVYHILHRSSGILAAIIK